MRVRQLLDDAAACRDNDPIASRQFALQSPCRRRAPMVTASVRPRRSIAGRASPTELATRTRRSGWRWRHRRSRPPRRRLSSRRGPLHLIGIVHYQASNFSEALEHCLRRARRLPDHRPPGRRGQHLEHGRGRLPLDGRQRPGDRHVRVGARGQRTAGSLRLRGARPWQHRPDPTPRARSTSSGESRPAAVDLARKHSPDIVSNLLADLAEAYMGLADHERASECFAEARRVWRSAPNTASSRCPRRSWA